MDEWERQGKTETESNVWLGRNYTEIQKLEERYVSKKGKAGTDRLERVHRIKFTNL